MPETHDAGPLQLRIIAERPAQYDPPLLRALAARSDCCLRVTFLSLAGALRPLDDSDMGQRLFWDGDLLSGFPWVSLDTAAPADRQVHGIDEAIGEDVEALLLWVGYRRRMFWRAMRCARRRQAVVAFGTDAHSFQSRSPSPLRSAAKRVLWPAIFRLPDLAIAPSTATAEMYRRRLCLPDSRIVRTSFTLDTTRWSEAGAQADRAAVRRDWGLSADVPVALFCAKLQPWKRPQDLLRALPLVHDRATTAVFVGDGALGPELRREARALGLESRVRFCGFRNQNELPSLYAAADVLVLPSDYEPFGVVVLEAMLCGLPAVVSDRVGAGPDLVEIGVTGMVFPAGDVPALAAALDRVLGDPDALPRMRVAAQARAQHVGDPKRAAAVLVNALRAARGGHELPR